MMRSGRADSIFLRASAPSLANSVTYPWWINSCARIFLFDGSSSTIRISSLMLGTSASQKCTFLKLERRNNGKRRVLTHQLPALMSRRMDESLDDGRPGPGAAGSYSEDQNGPEDRSHGAFLRYPL